MGGSSPGLLSTEERPKWQKRKNACGCGILRQMRTSALPLPLPTPSPPLISCVTLISVQFSSVQSFSRVRLFATPWTAACQASLSITNSWSLLKLMSIQSVMPSNHLILCCPFLPLPSVFPSIKVFSIDWFFTSGDQSTGASTSASVLPMNTRG